jgi:hypothetical protein
MPQIAESCSCGAALAMNGAWSDVYIAQQRFQKAHAACRTPSGSAPVEARPEGYMTKREAAEVESIIESQSEGPTRQRGSVAEHQDV